MKAPSPDLSRLTFDQALAIHLRLNDDSIAASHILHAIPGLGTGSMGLTPEPIRQSKVFRTAAKECDRCQAALRQFNGPFVKQFKKPYRDWHLSHREAKRLAQVAHASDLTPHVSARIIPACVIPEADRIQIAGHHVLDWENDLLGVLLNGSGFSLTGFPGTTPLARLEIAMLELGWTRTPLLDRAHLPCFMFRQTEPSPP